MWYNTLQEKEMLDFSEEEIKDSTPDAEEQASE
jgi:hypothetical protein